MKACYDAGKQVLARRLPRDLPVKVIKWSSTVGGPTIHVPKTFARWHTHSWSLAVAKDPKVTSKQAIPSHPKPSQAIHPEAVHRFKKGKHWQPLCLALFTSKQIAVAVKVVKD